MEKAELGQIVAASEQLDAIRDKARGEAEQILAAIEFIALLENPQDLLAEAFELLSERAAPQIADAFRHGKQAAWDLIADIPPKAPHREAPRALSETELERLDEWLEPWSLRTEAAAERAVIEITESVAAQNLTGRSREGILEYLQLDWERRGRTTGTFRREFTALAEHLINLADACGQECGMLGIGASE